MLRSYPSERTTSVRFNATGNWLLCRESPQSLVVHDLYRPGEKVEFTHPQFDDALQIDQKNTACFAGSSAGVDDDLVAVVLDDNIFVWSVPQGPFGGHLTIDKPLLRLTDENADLTDDGYIDWGKTRHVRYNSKIGVLVSNYSKSVQFWSRYKFPAEHLGDEPDQDSSSPETPTRNSSGVWAVSDC